MNKLNDIKQKIAALLAKADGTDNQFEAAIFMAKVNELLEKYQLDLAECVGASDPLGRQMGTTNIYASMTWARDLVGPLCRFYGARVIYGHRNKNHFPYSVVGRESARMTAEIMLPFVISQIKQRAKTFAKEQGITPAVAEREIGHGVRLRILNDLAKVEARRAELKTSDGTALIPINEVDAYLLEAAPDTQPVKPSKIKTTNSAYEEAQRVSLNVQATGKHTKLIGAA